MRLGCALVVVAASAPSCRGLAAREEPSSAALQRREVTPWGGIALWIPSTSTTCPSGTSSCNNSWFNGCCPAGTSCITHSTTQSGPLCCPSDSDCSPSVGAALACADTSWGLYHYGYAWCCLPDQLGVNPGGIGPECVARNLPVASSELVSSVTQAVAGATTTGQGGSQTTAASGPATTPNSDSSPGSNTSSSSSTAGLSQTALIVIGVLAVAVLLLLTTVVLLCCRQQRYRRRNLAYHSLARAEAHPPPPAVQQHALPGRHQEAFSPLPPSYKSPVPQTQEVVPAPAIPAGTHETDAAPRLPVVHEAEAAGAVRVYEAEGRQMQRRVELG